MARRQLVGFGATGAAIDHRIRRGRLQPVHQGVYAVGHSHLDDRAQALAGLLACGRGSVLAGESSAALLKIISEWPEQPEIAIPRRSSKSLPGLTVHRVRSLPPTSVTLHHGLPTTTAARTLLDLADTLGHQDLRAAVREAEYRRIVTRAQIFDAIKASPGRRGIPRLHEALDAGPERSRSEFEDAFFRLLRDAGLPLPESNVVVLGKRVDFLWRDQRVIVETDGRRAHGAGAAFEDDRATDARLTAAGYVVLRFTWRRLKREPLRIAAEVAAVLALR